MTDHRPQIDLDAVKDDVAFRTTVLVELKYISKDIEEVKVGLADHIEKDEQRFGTVNQKIGETASITSKGAGILIGVVALLGLVMWLLDRVKP